MSHWQELEAKYYMQTVKRTPITLVKGQGARVWDEDGGEITGNWTIQVVEDPDFDNDNDKMPRWWEEDNGLNDDDPTDADEDPDHDNLTNLQEYENATVLCRLSRARDVAR